jgi:osmoprotectant transport system substrate-binding protein
MKPRTLLPTLGLLAAQALAAGAPVVVASKIDTEGTVLGKIIIQVLTEHQIPVTDKVGFGTTDVVRKAIAAKEIDLYPEYTGNGEYFFTGTDPSIWKDEKKGYQAVKKLDLEKNQLVWLAPAHANNTWAIAVRKDLAGSNHLATLEDLGKYVNAGKPFKLAASEEFISRPDTLPAFQKAYGFTLKSNQLLSLSGGNTALTEKAAAQGNDGVNAAMAYGTDGSLAALGLVVLADTKGVQPIYEPAPVVRQEVLAQYPAIEKLLDAVFAKLDLVTLQTLNSRVAVNGEQPAAVAASWLKAQGLAK